MQAACSPLQMQACTLYNIYNCWISHDTSHSPAGTLSAGAQLCSRCQMQCSTDMRCRTHAYLPNARRHLQQHTFCTQTKAHDVSSSFNSCRFLTAAFVHHQHAGLAPCCQMTQQLQLPELIQAGWCNCAAAQLCSRCHTLCITCANTYASAQSLDWRSVITFSNARFKPKQTTQTRHRHSAAVVFSLLLMCVISKRD